MRITWSAAGGTDVGRVRSGNEDSYRIDLRSGVFLVADGMGGHAAGEVASALAADTVMSLVSDMPRVEDIYLPEVLRHAYGEAHRRIAEHSLNTPGLAGMGTTLTLAVLRRDGGLFFAHLGDSRLYQLHDGILLQLTHDHTWTQQEVDAGRIAAEAARSHPLAHILTRVLTTDEPAEPDVHKGYVAAGDVLLLCSDGLHNMVDGQTLLEHLIEDAPPQEIVEALIDTANERGGADNITAVVVRVERA